MKSFPLSELTRNSAAVRHEATRAPVTITDRNAPRFVLMAIEDYQKLTTRSEDPRRAFKLGHMPAEDRELLLSGLDRLIGDGDAD
jgi:prevent-host-death family protein